MEKLYAVAVVALMFVSCVCYGAEEGKYLFILSGQSNMVGMKPKRSFIPAVTEEFGEGNVIVVKDAKRGEPILRWYKEWTSPEGNEPEGRGVLYDRLMKKVGEAIKGEKIEAVSVIWMQGERDAHEGWGKVYAASLKGLIDQFREDLGREDINFVIGRISDFDMDNTRWPHWTIVREAQMQVAKECEHTEWINTDDLNDGDQEDQLHYTARGYRKLGARFAEKAIALIKE